MIVTFGQQKGGVGKTTLAVAFANYLTLVEKKKVKVFDYDYQKSFYQKWKEDESLGVPPLYEVEVIDDENEKKLLNLETIAQMKEDKEVYYLFDLAGTLDERYVNILMYSDFLIIPFEYSDVSTRSTLVFINLLGMIDSEARKVFVRSKYDKGYFYKNQEVMDSEIRRYGKLLESPIYKRNILQSINTRKLTYDQKYAVENTFKELIAYINEEIAV